jgi:hypothetical protein
MTSVKPSYRRAVEWIAINVGATRADRMNPKVVSHYHSVYLVAEIWGKERIRVAEDVVKFRFKFDPEEDRKL